MTDFDSSDHDLGISYKGGVPRCGVYYGQPFSLRRETVGGGRYAYTGETNSGIVISHDAAGHIAVFQPGDDTPDMYECPKRKRNDRLTGLAACVKKE
jgi:hypothetical protein